MKLYTLLKTQDLENHTLFSSTYPYRPNKGVPPGVEDELQTSSILEKAIDEESRGALLGILGLGVSPGSPNPDPISDQKGYFPHPFSDLARRQKLCYHYLD